MEVRIKSHVAPKICRQVLLTLLAWQIRRCMPTARDLSRTIPMVGCFEPLPRQHAAPSCLLATTTRSVGTFRAEGPSGIFTANADRCLRELQDGTRSRVVRRVHAFVASYDTRSATTGYRQE